MATEYRLSKDSETMPNEVIEEPRVLDLQFYGDVVAPCVEAQASELSIILTETSESPEIIAEVAVSFLVADGVGAFCGFNAEEAKKFGAAMMLAAEKLERRDFS